MEEHPMYSLLDEEIPLAQQQLRDSHSNLEKVAHYCRANYLQAPDKQNALEETKSYATQALASVAFQINALSYNLIQLFDHQEQQVGEMEAEVRHINQTVMIHKEKIARREIGALATTNKPMQRQHKVLQPPNPERAIRYTRRPIDYTVFDDLGHGIKSTHHNQPTHHSNFPRNVRKSSSSINSNDHPSNSSNSTYDAIYRKTGVAGSLTGTLSRNPATRNAGGDYRTPIPPAPPVAPPQYIVAKPPVNGANGSSRGDYYHPGVMLNYPGGATSPPVYNNNQRSPVPHSTHYASQKQIFQYPSVAAAAPSVLPSSNRKLSTGSSGSGTGGGYGTLPLNNISLNGNHSAHQPMHVLHALNNSNITSHHHHQQNYQQQSGLAPAPPPPPPPPPPVAGGSVVRNNHHHSNGTGTGTGTGAVTNRPNLASRTSSSMEVVTTPLLPPPPQSGDASDGIGMRGGKRSEENGSPDWVPEYYIDKVVAIYDYQADKDDELTFLENQIIYVIKKNDDNWWEGYLEGVRGLFPGNYVVPCA